MKAAVLHALGEEPRYEDFAQPTPGEDEALVRVGAASLENSDKMMADGSHDDSLDQLPAVVGIDGVGCWRTAPGCTAAALPNPALSSWLALERRAGLEPGETVLVLGATGVAGKLAVQVARHLGAGRVVGAGRNPQALAALAELGADATVRQRPALHRCRAGAPLRRGARLAT
jgi:NADPH2:quinone reductase